MLSFIEALSVNYYEFMIKYYLYILQCDQVSYYTGITSNLSRRFIEHAQKESFYTKRFSTVKLVYHECFASRLEARKREVQIKGWTRSKKEALINGNIKILKQLSKKIYPE